MARSKNQNSFQELEKNHFVELIEEGAASDEKELLKYCQQTDDMEIVTNPDFKAEHKIFLLKMKGSENKLDYRYDGVWYRDGDVEIRIHNMEKKSFCITQLDIDGDQFEMKAMFMTIVGVDRYRPVIYVDGERYEAELTKIDDKSKNAYNGKPLYERYGLRFAVKMKEGMTVSAVLAKTNPDKTEEETEMKLHYGKYSKLLKYKGSHYSKGNWSIYKDKDSLKVTVNTRKSTLKFEFRLMLRLLKRFKFSAIYWRIVCYLANARKKKEVWIISDRTIAADDSGKAFFEYLEKNPPEDIDFYFMVGKRAKYYRENSKNKRILAYGSYKYKKKYLIADKIISSQADNFTTRFKGKEWIYLKDLETYDFVFLQHGVIKDDLSSWANAWNKGIKLFNTSTKKEYESVLGRNYGYRKEEVGLLGLPRYDLLHSDENPTYVTIAPTWRKSLGGVNNSAEGRREYSEKIKTSKYFAFYNNLINDQRIIEVLKKHNLKGRFILHPSHTANRQDFKENGMFKVISRANYNQVFADSKLFVTDYSSTAFDFAYLKKPIIYTQFDKDTFYQQQSYIPGYFDYEKDAFGPIVYNYEDTVKEIIKTIEDGCKMPKKYQDRVDKTFAFHDRKNCERVYKAIREMK